MNIWKPYREMDDLTAMRDDPRQGEPSAELQRVNALLTELEALGVSREQPKFHAGRSMAGEFIALAVICGLITLTVTAFCIR